MATPSCLPNYLDLGYSPLTTNERSISAKKTEAVGIVDGREYVRIAKKSVGNKCYVGQIVEVVRREFGGCIIIFKTTSIQTAQNNHSQSIHEVKIAKSDVDILDVLRAENLIPAQTDKPKLNMLSVLQEVEALLPALLNDRNEWKSLFIDYKPPYLMRIFRDIKSNALDGKTVRINLHYFLPAKPESIDNHENRESAIDSGENLYHPHAWASCMRIIDGIYDQYIGFADKAGLDAEPPKLCSLTHRTGDSYSMNHPWLWHQVNPRPNQSVSTLMVTHIPSSWDQEVPKSTKKLRPLDFTELTFMFEHFTK